MRYWVTRARRGAWTPGEPHPGYDEYLDGKPTGRISGDGAMIEREPPKMVVYPEKAHTAPAEAAREPIRVSRVQPPPRPPREPLGVSAPVLQPGLRRNLEAEEKLRAALAKLDAGGRLSDPELSSMLIFWGVQIRAAEIIGQSHSLAYQAARAVHERLLEDANTRHWNQSLLAMLGVMVEGTFERITRYSPTTPIQPAM